MKHFDELKKNTKGVVDYGKKHKKEVLLIGAGGALLLVGGIVIGKKIGAGDSAFFTRQLGDTVRDIKVTQPIPLPEGVSKIYKQIDEDIFVDVASELENALINLDIEDFYMERSWEVADGVVKNLVINMETVSK